MPSKTYLIFNIKILKGREANDWQLDMVLEPNWLKYIPADIVDGITRGEVLNNDDL